MAHVRKDTLVTSPEWWKHLKWNKKIVSKAERQAAKKQISDELTVSDKKKLKKI